MLENQIQKTLTENFLKEFCEEVDDIKKSGGIFVGDNAFRTPVTIRLFCCDAPARAFISNAVIQDSKVVQNVTKLVLNPVKIAELFMTYIWARKELMNRFGNVWIRTTTAKLTKQKCQGWNL